MIATEQTTHYLESVGTWVTVLTNQSLFACGHGSTAEQSLIMAKARWKHLNESHALARICLEAETSAFTGEN